ncbi:MAG: sulfite exporter TauE/SafE family protein [Anaerolineales bacterium]
MTWFAPSAYLGALVLGVVVGALTGMFGVGGGFLATPLLTALLGIPMPYAVGTSLVQMLGTTTSTIYCRRHDGLIDYKLALTLIGGNWAGVSLGTDTLNSLKRMGEVTVQGHAVPAADFYTLLAYVVLLAGIAAWMLYDTSRQAPDLPPERCLFARLKLPPYTTFPSLGGQRYSIPVLAYLGVLLGFLTGLLGVGGGVILVPALVYLVGLSPHKATATSLVMVWCSSAIAIVGHTLAGNTRLDLALPLLLGGSVGAQLGVALANRTGGGKLKRYFAWVAVLAILVVVWKLSRMLG